MSKKARTGGAPQPEDLVKGSVVLFNGGQRGVVTDAFAPLDQFWVADEATNAVIRDDDGNIFPFSAADLQLVPPPEKKPGGCAKVLLIGSEQHMLQILEQFGAPDASARREPQQLLAVPCPATLGGDESPLLQMASEGIDEAMHALARRLRPDIVVDVRASHLTQALEHAGPGLRKLEGYYCLSAVTLPYGQAEIATASGWERYWMQDIRNQIDLGVSAEGAGEKGEADLEDTARRALGEACGINLADALWTEEMQFSLRRKLKVDLPLKFWDGPESKVFVLILPEDASSSVEKGLLTFFLDERHAVSEKPGSRPAPVARAAGQAAGPGGKTIAEWKADQEQFKDLPKLPAGWIRIRSRTNAKDIYYWNVNTNKASYEVPLPEGWTKQTSKSTGKTYYFNAKKRKSTFEVPTE